MAISKRQKEERVLRKEKILLGALEIFKKHGLENATMDEIALESGFGTATIYYYFLSKEEILLVGQDLRYLNLDYPYWRVFNRSLLNYKFYSLLFFIVFLEMFFSYQI